MMTPRTIITDADASPLQCLRAYSGLVWHYRHFALHLAKADVRARFRRSVLGVVWAMLQPLFLSIIFAYVLVLMMNAPFEEYSIYVMTGFIMWEMITGACMLGATSLIGSHSYLLQNRIPIAVFAVRTVLHLLTIFAAGIMSLAIYGSYVYPQAFAPTWALMPFYALLIALFCLPLAVICGILNAILRDFQQLLQLLLQVLWLLSPVFISRQIFDTSGLAGWTSLNPIASLCDVMRAILMHGALPERWDLLVIGGWTLVLTGIAAALIARFDRRIIFYM